MKPGATIVVKAGNQLEMTNTVFTTCPSNNLWESIILKPGATLIANGCRFEQARYAIAAQANTTVHLSNCTFKDNYIGIKYEGDASSGDLLVRGSRFYHENGLNETVQGTTRSYAGMDIRGISIAQVQGLADASGTISNTTFTGLHNGILSGASQLDVADATFSDLNHSYQGRGQTGYGIYQRGSRGVVAGLSVDNGANTAPSAIFNDCRIGIYANQSTGGRFQYLYNNYIYLNTANAGRKGVQIAGSFRPFLSFNQIFGPSATNYNSTFGIWADGLADPTLECNTTKHLDKGMQFWGLNDNTDLRGNTFHAGGTGLQIGIQNTNGIINNAAIDEQIQRGNSWDGMFGSGYGAFHASDELEYWQQSLFEVNSDQDDRFYPDNNVPSFGWFRNIPNPIISTFVCPTAPLPPSNEGVYDKPTELEGKITAGEFRVSGYENTSRGIAQGRLLERWSSSTTTGLGSPKFQQFISAMGNTSVGQLQADKGDLEAAVSINKDDVNALMEATNSIEELVVSLRTTPPASQRSTLLAALGQYQNILSVLLVDVDNQRELALGALSPELSTPTNGGMHTESHQAETLPFLAADYEVQQLIIQEDYEQLAATDSLLLLTLGESCPWLNGDAVYKARALFGKLNPEYTFDGDYCSNNGLIPLQQAETNISPLSMELFPNPAKDYLLVRLNRPLATQQVCQVYDITGKEIMVDWLQGEGNTLLLETMSLLPGVYIIEIRAKEGEKVSQKFIKQ